MKIFIVKFIFLLSLAVLCFTFAQNASAAALDLNNNYPLFPGAPDINTEAGQQLNGLIAWFYYAVIGISGLAALITIIIGGVQLMTSAGSPSGISEARDRIKNALLGLLVIFASYLILNTVNPRLLTLTLPGLPQSVEDDGGGGLTPPNGSFTANNQEKALTISPNEEITLKWNVQNTDRCQANSYCQKCTGENETIENSNWSGELNSTRGSKTFELKKTTQFYITCYGNTTYQNDVLVTVSSCSSDCKLPEIDFRIKTVNGLSNGPINSAYSEIPSYILEFTWNVTDANKCVGTLPSGLIFSESTKTSDSFTTVAMTEYRGWKDFTLKCSNDNGSTIKTIKINFDYP